MTLPTYLLTNTMIIYTWRWHHVIRVEKEKDDILSISDFISESPFS